MDCPCRLAFTSSVLGLLPTRWNFTVASAWCRTWAQDGASGFGPLYCTAESKKSLEDLQIDQWSEQSPPLVVPLSCFQQSQVMRAPTTAESVLATTFTRRG